MSKVSPGDGFAFCLMVIDSYNVCMIQWGCGHEPKSEHTFSLIITLCRERKWWGQVSVTSRVEAAGAITGAFCNAIIAYIDVVPQYEMLVLILWGQSFFYFARICFAFSARTALINVLLLIPVISSTCL